MNKFYMFKGKFYFRCVLTTLLMVMSGVLTLNAQPWTYDFGTATGTANNSNSGSGNTSFFTGTPSGGGTYRVRIGSQGGSLVLANPGTTLGSGSEVQLTAATGTSTNKLGIYGWSSPTTLAYTKFKMRTTTSASGAAIFYIHLGTGASSTIFNDNNSAASYSASITTLAINYASGSISSVTRRNGSNNTAISGHGFLKDSNQVVEIYANNSNGQVTYNKDGSQTLNATSWDLYVDGTKISPNGGFAKGGITTGANLAGIAFMGESSAGNNGVLYLDDIEYSNTLPTSCTAPTGAPEGFSDFSVADQTSIELEWLNGNGAGRVIVMNTVNSFTNLSEGADPTANTTYGGGEQVVYNDTGYSPITINGLLPGTKYYFKGYEYCSPDRVYKNNGAVDSITTEAGSNTITTEASGYGPFCNGSAHNINVAFTSEGAFNGTFKVQLSDADGIFPPNTVDNIIGSGTSPITAAIPVNTPAGNGYRVRVINEDPLTLGDDNGSDIVIAAAPGTPGSAVPAPVCEGIAAVITGAGSVNATTYTFWDSLSGGNQIVTGVTGNTLTTSSSLAAGTYVYYVQGENASCVSLTRQPVEVTVHAVPAVPSGTFAYSANPSCGPATIGFDAGYYFQTSPAGTSQAFPTSSSYTLNTTGTLYVRAFNGNCWSSALAADPVT